MEKQGRFLNMIDVLVICWRQLTISNLVECGRLFKHWNFPVLVCYSICMCFAYIERPVCICAMCGCVFCMFLVCVFRYQLDKYTVANMHSLVIHPCVCVCECESERKFRAWISLCTLNTLAENHQRQQHIGSTFTLGIGWLHVQNTKWASIFRPFSCVFYHTPTTHIHIRVELRWFDSICRFFMWLILLYVQNVSFAMCAKTQTTIRLLLHSTLGYARIHLYSEPQIFRQVGLSSRHLSFRKIWLKIHLKILQIAKKKVLSTWNSFHIAEPNILICKHLQTGGYEIFSE